MRKTFLLQAALSMTSHAVKYILDDGEGHLHVELRRIDRIGIQNIGDVVRHEITTIFGSRSHVVHFVNGGVLRFAYNDKVELIELSSSKLRVTVTSSGEALFDVPDADKRGLVYADRGQQ